MANDMMSHRFSLIGIEWFYFCPKKFKSFILKEKEKEEKGLAKFIIDEKDIRVEHSHFHIDYRKKIALGVCMGCLGFIKIFYLIMTVAR